MPVSLEQLVGKPSGQYGSDDSQQGVYRYDGYGLCIGEAFRLLQEQHAPPVDGIAGYVHECARGRENPHRRRPQYLLLNLFYG